MTATKTKAVKLHRLHSSKYDRSRTIRESHLFIDYRNSSNKREGEGENHYRRLRAQVENTTMQRERACDGQRERARRTERESAQ